jgi:hypothetical protein
VLLTINSHFSLPIVAVPDVALNAPDVLCTLLHVAVNTVSGCIVAYGCCILSESATIVEAPVSDAIPPLVANPSTVILALAVGVPEPNLTRLHIAAIVAVGLTVAAPLTINTPSQVILTVALGFALLSLTLTIVEAGTTVDSTVIGAALVLTLVPLPVLVATVTDVPFIRTEPRATLLANALTVAVPSNVALPTLIFSAEHVTVDVADIIVCRLDKS